MAIDRTTDLHKWLDKISHQHPLEMDLGLDRITAIGQALQLLTPTVPIITVGGTNGKGSCVATLEAIYLAAGYRVATYTSPHLFDYRERIRINQQLASPLSLINAFEVIENECKRQEITLTYFEYSFLAALSIFQTHQCDIFLLEVGLGGRLDAVNCIDSTVAVITSIDLDHQAYLGNTREAIASEKAGIFRKNRPAICGDFIPPDPIYHIANKLNVSLYCQQSEFSYGVQGDNTWCWHGVDTSYQGLPMPAVLLQNAATALMAIESLQSVLSVKKNAIVEGLERIYLIGRCQYIPGNVDHIVDVAHNPAAVKQLREFLEHHPCDGKTWAIVGMLTDKDITACLSFLEKNIDKWYLTGLPLAAKRGCQVASLKSHAIAAGISSQRIQISVEPVQAYNEIHAEAKPHDRVIIFGSFYTVAAIWPLLVRDNIIDEKEGLSFCENAMS